jgi:hypothetical protein
MVKMRLQTFYLLNPQLPDNNRFNSPEEMMPFDWDKTPELKEGATYIPNWEELDRIYCKN